MLKKGWLGIIVVAVAVVVLWFVSHPRHQTKTSTAITVGAILPLTGDAAAWGKQAHDAITLAADEFNGTQASVKVVVDYQDTKGDPKEAVTAANFLILNRKVVAIIGDMTSATTLAAVPVCEKNGVVIISPVASSPKLTGAGKFVYRIWPPDTFEASFTANWLIQKAYSRVTVVYLLDDFGVPLKDAFRTAFESRKGEIAIEEGYPKGTTDFRTLLLKVRGSVKGIYLISHYSDAAQFVRQAKVLGIDTPIVGTSDLLNDEFVRQGGAAVEGVYFPQRKGFDPDGSSTQTQRFVEAFSKRFGRKPGLVEGQAYDAAGLVFATIRNGARTGAEIKQQFDKLANNPYQGVTGALSFDGHGDLTFSAAGFRMGRIQNGKFTALD